MSAGARKQKKSQDKVPLAPWEVKANDGGDDEASQSSSFVIICVVIFVNVGRCKDEASQSLLSSSDDGKSEGHVAETKKKKEERVEP